MALSNVAVAAVKLSCLSRILHGNGCVYQALNLLCLSRILHSNGCVFVLVLGPAGGRCWLALSGGVEKFPPVFVHILDKFLGGAKGGGQPPCRFLPLLVFCRCVGVFFL